MFSITPSTIITAELLAGLAKCPVCNAGIYYKETIGNLIFHCGSAYVQGKTVLWGQTAACPLRARVKELEKDCKQLQGVAQKADEEICQTLGKSLGYPWFKDDPKNFPECTEADGVCVGDHCGATLALEMVDRVKELEDQLNAANTQIGLLVSGSKKQERQIEFLQAKIQRLVEAGDELDLRLGCGCLDGPCSTCSNRSEAWTKAKEGL